MSFDELRDIIDFAINKEQEAMDFYSDLAGKVKHKAIAEELQKMVGVEQEHRDRLKAMDVGEASKTTTQPAQNLKIADYLVDLEPAPNMSWQDVVHIAMKRELAAMNLYTDLAKTVTDQNAKQLFENLAADESAHKLYFEKTWDDEIMKDW
jgi:rubrerythrin